jgi:hypothetical protein
MNLLGEIADRAYPVNITVRITRRDCDGSVIQHKAVPITYLTGYSPSVYINIDEENINKAPWKNWSEAL